MQGCGNSSRQKRREETTVLDKLGNPFLTLHKFYPVQHRLHAPTASGPLSKIGWLMEEFISYSKQPIFINQVSALQEFYHQDPPRAWKQGGSSGKIFVSVHCTQEGGNLFFNGCLMQGSKAGRNEPGGQWPPGDAGTAS